MFDFVVKIFNNILNKSLATDCCSFGGKRASSAAFTLSLCLYGNLLVSHTDLYHFVCNMKINKLEKKKSRIKSAKILQ